MGRSARRIGVVLALTLALPAHGAGLPRLDEQQWRQDLDYLVRTMKERHPDPFHDVSEARFAAEVASLESRLGTLETHQIIVELAALTALIGDGHSGIPVLSRTIDFHYYPLRLYLYADGLFVQGTRSDLGEILMARVLAIGGVPVDEAIRRIVRLLPRDNVSSARTQVGGAAAVAEVLHAVELSDSPGRAIYTLECTTGDRRTILLEAEPMAETRPFVLGFGAAAERFTTIFDVAPRTPLWRSRSDPYWFEVVEEDRLLFVQINEMLNSGDRPLAEFFEAALAAGDEAEAERLVIDLRLNDGGNDIHLPLVHAIIRHPRFNETGQLFVAIGPGTFSSAQTFATSLEEHTRAIFVGEPTGGKPNHYGEGGAFFLPNSGLRVRHSRVYFQNSSPSDTRPWIPPDVYAPRYSAADAAGRDPALEAILGWKRAPALHRVLADAHAGSGLDGAWTALAEFRREPANAYRDVESALNRFGYHLLGQDETADAIEVFRANARMHPQSPNVHDSLGEGLAVAGRNDEAIAAYRRVLELEPSNRNAPGQLQRLVQQQGSPGTEN